MIDFLGIGAQKCGTTWLYRMLETHPALSFPAGKEVHFWDREKRPHTATYQNQFPSVPGILNGEITPAYAMLSLPTIQELHAVNPGLRVLYSMRNPMDRAWSSACMALRRAELTIEEASDQWFIDHFNSVGSLKRGDYEGCLRNWRSVFDQKSILLVRFDDIVKQPAVVLSSCAVHLGVDPNAFPQRTIDMMAEKVFAGAGLPLRPSLLPELARIYRPRVEALQDYLDWDLSNWFQVSSSNEAAR
ncbi:MAG: sulfotransferase [Xanthomonadales bacterium]|nr:sulfotransferase [Xanthomonadales bacterium]